MAKSPTKGAPLTLLCPVCKTPLVITHRDRYQDLSEHVSDPNGTPSLKPGYQCLNVEWCVANKYQAVWIEDGDFFLRDGGDVGYSKATEAIKKASKSGHLYALNSFHHFIETGKDRIKKLRITINLGKYRIIFEPKEKGWDYPEDQRHMPNIWRWRMEYWKKTSEYGYTNIIPIPRMVKFLVNQFKNSFELVLERGKDRDIENCMRIISRKNGWGSIDDRAFSKIASIVVMIFYPVKRKFIIDLARERGIKNS